MTPTEGDEMEISMKIKWKLSELCLLFFALIPIIDTIYGYFLNNGQNIQIGPLFRMLFFVLLIVVITLYGKNEQKEIMIYSIAYFVITCVIHVAISSNANLVDDLQNAVKFLLYVFSVVVIKILFERRLIDKKNINSLFDFYSLYVPLSLIVPTFLKIGFTVYSDGTGYKGFYWANNEINIFNILTLAYLFYKLTEKNEIKTVFLFILNVLSILLEGAKAGYLAIVVCVLYYLFRSGRKRIKLAIVVLIGIFCAFILYEKNKTFFVEIYARSLYHYNVYKNGGITFLDFATSYRTTRFSVIPEYLDSWSKWIFGNGYYSSYLFIELDILDILVLYGLPAAAFVTVTYLIVLVKSIKKSDEYSLIGILVIIFSVLAGHVIFSAMIAPIFGMITYMVLEERDE